MGSWGGGGVFGAEAEGAWRCNACAPGCRILARCGGRGTGAGSVSQRHDSNLLEVVAFFQARGGQFLPRVYFPHGATDDTEGEIQLPYCLRPEGPFLSARGLAARAAQPRVSIPNKLAGPERD